MTKQKTLVQEAEDAGPLIQKTIRIPQKYWDALHRDAVTCKRSDNQQVEAIFGALYFNEFPNLNAVQLEMTRRHIVGELPADPQIETSKKRA